MSDCELGNMKHILLRLKDILFPKPVSVPKVSDSIWDVPFQKAFLIFTDWGLH